MLLSFLHRFVPSEYAIEIRNLVGWAVWDIVAYATIVTFGTVARLAGRYRDALVAMTGTRSRIANARLASLRLRLQPAVLLRGLDAIGVALSADPERAEHAIARMGDLLRSLLSRVDRDSVSLDIELSTLRAFVDVVDPGATLVVHGDARDTTVPAVLLTPLAAALDGLTSIVVRAGGDAVDVRLHARGDAIDNAQLAQVRDRVQRRYDQRASLSVDLTAGGGADVQLHLPLERSAMSEDDELVFEPALGIA
jgi:LytS/YehU family sensor histidine kinase